MSWLGGSLSSLTGQISNLTKDILTEGTEETSDQGAELRIAKEKIQDCQNVITALNTENERLKKLNDDLEEKAESSELQINTISQQYRQLLEEKQTEIKKLKESQNELLLHQSSPTYPSHQAEYNHYNGSSDDLDFSDSIGMQHEINKLRKENQRLKTINDQLKQSQTDTTTNDKHQKEIEDLQRKLKDVSEQLSAEKENHQHELVSLQDVHSQKASVLRKKFKDEISQYKQKILELEENLSALQSTHGQEETKADNYAQLEQKWSLLEDEHRALKEDYEVVCRELKNAKNQLLDQLDSNHAQSLELLGDLREVRRQFGYEIIRGRDNLLEDKQYFIQQLIDSVHQQEVLRSEIDELEGEQDGAISQADSMVTALGKQNTADSSHDRENILLKKKNLELQEQIVLLERSLQSVKEEKDTTVDDDILNAIKADLESEKEALEEVLLDLRAQLKEKEMELITFKDKLEKQETENEGLKREKEDLEKSINESKIEQESETFQEELTKKTQMLEELSAEKNELETSLIELDAQHQEEMNQVISIRNDMSSKLEESRSKVHELTEVKDNLSCQKQKQEELIEQLRIEVSQLEEEIQNLKTERNELSDRNKSHSEEHSKTTKELEEKDKMILSLQENLQEKDSTIKSLEVNLNPENNEPSSETLQKIHDLQGCLETKEKTVEQLKSDCISLQEDKELAESSLSKLQQEVELVRKQHAEMQEKFNKGALTINDLHMDVQELQQKLTKAEADLNSKIQEIHTLQDMQNKLEQNVRDLEEERNIILKNTTDSTSQQSTIDTELEIKIQEIEKLSLENLRLIEKEKDYLMYKEETDKQIIELSNRLKDQEQLLNQVEMLTTDKLSLESTLEKLQESLDEKVQYYENIIKEFQSQVDSVSSEELITKEEIKQTKSSPLGADPGNSADDKTHRALSDDIETSAINTLQQTVDKLENELQVSAKTIQDLQQEVDDQKSGITELNSKCQELVHALKDKEGQMTKQEGILTVLRQVSIEKDEEINYLSHRMTRALSLMSNDQHTMLDMNSVPNYSLPALEYHEKGTREQGENDARRSEEKGTREQEENDGRSPEKASREEQQDNTSIREMERLQGLIKEKDDVISELQNNNAALLKVMENKSMSTNERTVVDINRLENEVRNLKIEREQIMAVMNEKSREASSLKSEVHRLMNVVAAEKSAIDKLQKDIVQGSGHDDNDDMHREALQNLSRLVRDKDLEVEALKQKNETLLAVLQDTSTDGSELGTLMQDKENLSRQLKVLQEERDQMVVFVNQKHEESVKYHQEVQRLTQYINTELEKHGVVQQQYAKLAPQFEDKKQALLKAQNELINYKQKYTELEVKYGEMVQKVNSSDTVDITTYNSQGQELKHTQEKLKEANESLRELEQKVSVLHQQNVEYEEELAKRENEVHGMKKQIDILSFQLQGAQGQLTDLKQEHSQSEKESSEHASHMTMLKESNNRLTLELQDRDFDIKSLQEKLHTLTSVVEGQRDEEGQVNKLLKENEQLMTQIKELQQERHQTLMALKQRQIETEELRRECQKHKDKETKFEKELQRLRGHLIQMEEAYTKDALESEEREKDLRNRLAVAEEKVLSSSSAIQSASQQAVQEVESLQQQLHQVASQRDQAYLQLSSLQDQVQQYSVSLSNLQLVLEQFQRDKENQVSTEIDKYQRENVRLERAVKDLKENLKTVEEKLEDAEDGLEAAARLHQQLDKCDATISALREEVQLREAALKNAEVEISDLRNSKDAKVDKLVIKSMLLGYFTAPKNKQDDILHTIGSILNFGPDEFEKVLGSRGRGGWMSGWLGLSGQATPPTTPTRRHTVTSTDKPNKSFSELFVKFLETESSPKQTMRLPAEEMAQDVQRHHKPVFNPFTAPRHVDDQTTRQDKHLLMPSSPLSSALPVFVDSSRTSSAILNDVLKSS